MTGMTDTLDAINRIRRLEAGVRKLAEHTATGPLKLIYQAQAEAYQEALDVITACTVETLEHGDAT